MALRFVHLMHGSTLVFLLRKTCSWCPGYPTAPQSFEIRWNPPTQSRSDGPTALEHTKLPSPAVRPEPGGAPPAGTCPPFGPPKKRSKQQMVSGPLSGPTLGPQMAPKSLPNRPQELPKTLAPSLVPDVVSGSVVASISTPRNFKKHFFLCVHALL